MSNSQVQYQIFKAAKLMLTTDPVNWMVDEPVELEVEVKPNFLSIEYKDVKAYVRVNNPKKEDFDTSTFIGDHEADITRFIGVISATIEHINKHMSEKASVPVYGDDPFDLQSRESDYHDQLEMDY